MTFDPNFPTSATRIPNFQQILTNWSKLNSLFGTDHAPYTETDVDKQGHHQFVRMYQVAGDPTLAKPQSQCYTKDQAIPATIPAPGVPTDIRRALYFAEKPNTGPQIIRQLTDLPYVTATATTTGTNFVYRSYDTPWGWRILMGQLDGFTPGTKTFTLAVSFLSTIIYSGATSFGASGAQASYNVSPNGGLTTVVFNMSASVPAKVIVISTDI